MRQNQQHAGLHCQRQRPVRALNLQHRLRQTRSRHSSTLGQAVPVKDGVGISRPNTGPPKQNESLLNSSPLEFGHAVHKSHFRVHSDLTSSTADVTSLST